MDPLENERSVANEVTAYAQAQGVDLATLRNAGLFCKGERWIYLWRRDELPCSGRVGDPLGLLRYNLQGPIEGHPRGVGIDPRRLSLAWSESGILEDIGHAFNVVKSWIVDWREVDELPIRTVRRSELLY